MSAKDVRRRPKKRNKNPTKPGVFIIESNEWEDEQDEDFEGKILSRMLQMSRIKHDYYYIRTEKELNEVLSFFEDSKYRYLHIACHGDEKNLFTTVDTLTFLRFVRIIEPYIGKKRLFISACSAVNDKLADKLFERTKCVSLTGPANDIFFSDAAIIWTTFYYLMFKQRKRSMRSEDIVENLKYLSKIFSININFYYRHSEDDVNYTRSDSFSLESTNKEWINVPIEVDNIDLSIEFKDD